MENRKAEQTVCYPRAADVLEERADEIFEDYVSRLRTIGSPLTTEKTKEQIETQAFSVLRETAKTLREGRASVESNDNTSTRIGTSRARSNVHPSESLRAASALSSAALSVVVENLPSSENSRSEIASMALALQEVVLTRVAHAAISYVDYLFSKVREGQVEERRRISRELHDRVNHSLAVVCKSLELYEALREQDAPRAHEKAEIARQTAEDALKFGTELSQDLRSSEADAGLEVALSDLVHARISQYIKAWVSFKGDESCIPTHIRNELFLVLREAIRNAADHSSAKTIRIEVACTRSCVTAKVEDDGCGFDPETARSPSDGIGLDSMVERVAFMGGQCSVESSPGQGARVEVAVPLASLRER